MQKDPKLIWAERFLYEQPIEINRASRGELLQIPGIGPKNALSILHLRKTRAISDMSVLRKIGVHTKHARDFILLNGKRPIRQLLLF